MEKRLERIIVTLRLTVAQHHARAHLAPPPVVARTVLPVVSHSKMDHSRDPCPWVILNDFGGAFAMGVGTSSPLRFLS